MVFREVGCDMLVAMVKEEMEKTLDSGSFLILFSPFFLVSLLSSVRG